MCPPPCSCWDTIEMYEPNNDLTLTIPKETDEFLFYKGSGSSSDYSRSRERALKNAYDKIFDSLQKRSKISVSTNVQDIVIKGVITMEEHDRKTITLYRHLWCS